MPVIDAHCHIYPEKIASRAALSIQDFYDMRETITMCGGTVDDLSAHTQTSPISHFLVHSVATKASNVESINTFIAEKSAAHPEFIGFGTMHHDYEDPEPEINRIIELGLHGVKIHPDIQMVNMDDPRLMRVYEILEARSLPVVIHCGDFRHNYSNPERLVKVLAAFPELKVDAAHFGNWSRYEIGYDVLGSFDNVFIDTSSSSYFLGKRRMEELIRLWGTERVMFGSDYPMWDPIAEYDLMADMNWTDEERDNIFWHNAERFAGVIVS